MNLSSFNEIGVLIEKIPYLEQIRLFLEGTGFGSHILGFLVFLGFLVVARIFIFVYEGYLLKLAEKSKNRFDDKIIKGIRKPVFFGLLFLGVYFGIKIVEFPDSIQGYINKIILSFVVLFFAYFVIKIFDFIVCNYLKSFVEKSDTKIDDVVFPLLHKIMIVVFVVIGFLALLHLWGVQIGPLLASLGVAGIIIGFALKESLENIIGGVSLIVDRSFKVGDYIKIDEENKGRVVDIGIRSTKLKTMDNQLIVIPNGKVSNSRLMNYAKPDMRARISIPVSVEYGSNVEKVKKVLLDCVHVVDEKVVDKDKEPKVYFIDMGDYALKFKLIVYITNYKKRFVNEEKLRVEVYNNFKKYKIKIPFPTYKIEK